MPKKQMSTEITAEFEELREELEISLLSIMDYVEKEYREFCAANAITLEKGTRVTA